MYTAARISREQFLNSHFLKVSVLQFEKNYLHHNRFILEVITDRNKEQVKKKFSEILRFSEEMSQRVGLKDLHMETHIRASKKLEQVEMLFKKLNTVYLAVGGGDPQALALRAQIRNYLYNLLFSNIEQLPSSEDEDETRNSYIGNGSGSPGKDKGEKKEEKLEWERSEKVEKVEKGEKGEKGEKVEKGERMDKLQLKERKDSKQSKETTKFPHVIRNIFKPKRESQDLHRRQLLKGIKSIWIRQEKNWSERLFSITDDSLIFIQRAQPQQKSIIFLKYLQAKFKEEDYYRIVLTHPLLTKEIEIRVHSFEGLVLDEREEYVNFVTALREICEKGQREAHNFVGVFLSNKKNKFMVEPEKRPAQRLNVRFSHEQDSYCFTMAIDSGVFLQLPVVSNYGKFQAEITQEREGSLLPTLSSEKSISFPLPVQGIYDQLYNDKPKRKTPEMRSHLLESKQCNYSIRLEYFPLTSWQAYCSGAVKDRFEGVDQPNEFSRGEFRIQKNRIKRILYSIEDWMVYLGGLRSFEYPLRSIIFYLFLLVAVIEFDANHILQYCLAGGCLLLAYLHPASGVYCRDLIAYGWSSEWVKTLETGLQEKRWRANFKVGLKKVEERRKFLEDFNIRKKKKRNILQKYNRLQQVLLKGQLALTEVVTLCQKVKNLFCWYHHRKTKWLFLVLLCLFLLLFLLPLRAMAVIGLAVMCQRGWNRQGKTYQLNQFVVLAVLKLIAEEEGLTTLRENLADTNRPFDKRTTQYGVFEKKTKEGLGEILGLQFDSGIFLYGKTIGEIVSWLAECRQRLIIPEEICRKHHFNLQWSRSGGRVASFLTALYLLLLSVPSDRSILDVKHEPEEQEDSEQDELP